MVVTSILSKRGFYITKTFNPEPGRYAVYYSPDEKYVAIKRDLKGEVRILYSRKPSVFDISGERFPKFLQDKLHLKQGDRVELSFKGSFILIYPPNEKFEFNEQCLIREPSLLTYAHDLAKMNYRKLNLPTKMGISPGLYSVFYNLKHNCVGLKQDPLGCVRIISFGGGCHNFRLIRSINLILFLKNCLGVELDSRLVIQVNEEGSIFLSKEGVKELPVLEGESVWIPPNPRNKKGVGGSVVKGVTNKELKTTLNKSYLFLPKKLWLSVGGYDIYCHKDKQFIALRKNEWGCIQVKRQTSKTAEFLSIGGKGFLDYLQKILKVKVGDPIGFHNKEGYIVVHPYGEYPDFDLTNLSKEVISQYMYHKS